ncbi:TPA: hypothetical protein RWN27_003107 [Stenotrophomonas maltophilia]|uniref:hypothetical protein n=1 Tax=Stenotrophomonas maltophilia TaxID=40324 RepID=UPI001AA1B06E|nr:hypothetical protein [Stenotrophomonas maltophilia]ELF4111090.1 hypothetical protein [Stenotrophomonas maltophilia]MBO1745409.1 hypothetical protein [Stenotrophomonas maltophilia]MCU1176018.1 hypothetical protein [Stenotrophomonas maltophilia]HEA4093511.1 hypothetical protein [Stenotrophomonas maltophilia]HEA4098331.1 hypothetical protein [Stenotrophomonas maltophilia]
MRAAAGALCVLLLAGCQSDPSLHSTRIGPDQYRLQVDRCHVIDRAQLESDLQALAARKCPAGAGALQNIQSLPSHQGSLFGECLRRGALQAEVRCAP